MKEISVDLSDVRIESERLVLRGFINDDLGDFYAYASVPGVGEAAGWPHHTSENVTAAVLNSFIRDKNVLALELKENNTVIGSIGLHASLLGDDPEFENLRLLEVGYVLSKGKWGQGLMTEAVRALTQYCFDTMELDGLTVGHFIDNDRSRRVAEKCGFVFVREGEYSADQLGVKFRDRRYILLNRQRQLTAAPGEVKPGFQFA